MCIRDRTNTERHAAVAKRKETLLGTNEFPNFTETAHEKLATPAVITLSLIHISEKMEYLCTQANALTQFACA